MDLNDQEYETFARAHCSARLLSDLEQWPILLPGMSTKDLIVDGIKLRLMHDEMCQLLRDEMQTDGSDDVFVAAVGAEFTLRKAVRLFADEMERRRTGIAPRARTLN